MTKLTKLEFNEVLIKWLEDFLENKFPKSNIEVFSPEGVLSKSNHPKIKKIANYPFFEFKPDIVGVLEINDKFELVILNRELRAFSLKDVGEMQCYCRISNPRLAFMASLQGIAPQIDKLINHNKKHEIISYDHNSIKIFRWDDELNKIDQFSITPLEERNFFNL